MVRSLCMILSLQASSLLRKGCQSFLVYMVSYKKDLKLKKTLYYDQDSNFLGFVGYMRFIEGFSKITLPLTKLTQKGG